MLDEKAYYSPGAAQINPGRSMDLRSVLRSDRSSSPSLHFVIHLFMDLGDPFRRSTLCSQVGA